MKVAVIGAGFSGLSVAWHLLKKVSVTLFDKEGIGAGASGIAAGLLHPFAGKWSKLNWNGFLAMQETCALIDEAQKEEKLPLADKRGILRPVVNEEQKEAFFASFQKYPKELTWQENRELSPALFISCGMVVHSQRYLQALFKSCQNMGLEYEQKEISSAQELSHFDKIVICTGSGIHSIQEAKSLVVPIMKGQILELQLPEDPSLLDIPLVSQGYILKSEKANTCVAGSTYEKSYRDLFPDVSFAEPYIRKKIKEFSPLLAELPLISCKAQGRVSSHNHLPFIKKLSQKTYCLSGMGSKGLLYHAWMGKLLAHAVLEEREDHIPKEVLFS